MADSGRSRSSKRLKLDPDFVHELSDDHFEEVERYVSQQIPTNELSPVDTRPVKEVSLASLPMELIQEIFMFLSIRDKMSLKLVNRHLYTICSDPYLWRNVFIDDAYGRANRPFVKSTLKTCQPHVQSLSLKGKLPFSQYQSIVFNSKNIHTLNLYGFEINLGALKKILVSPTLTRVPLPHLQYLTLSIYSRQCYELVEAQFSCLSHLKKLVIITNKDTASWQQFNQNWEQNHCLPHLFVLVSDFTWYRDYSVPNMSQPAYFVYHTRYCRPLKFDFYDVPRFRGKCGPDDDSDILAVTANGELMVKVRDFVTPITQPNDDELCRKYAIFKKEDIAPGLPVYSSQLGNSISVLHFDSISVSLETFSLIVRETPNVLEVSLHGSRIWDSVDAYMAPLSEHCLKLRGLNLSCFRYSDGVHLQCSKKIDKEHFWHLLSKMKYLELLSISCFMLPPNVVDSPYPGNKALILSDSDNNMIDYIKSMSRLKGLHLYHGSGICYKCHGLNNPLSNRKKTHNCLIHHFLILVISNLRFLTYLRVEFPLLDSGSTNGLEEVLQHCQQLSVLIITGAVKLTLPVDPSLYSSLTHLWLDCKDTLITSEFVAALAINSRKHLKHFVADVPLYIPVLHVGDETGQTQPTNISVNVLIELIESCSFVTFHFLNFPKEEYNGDLLQKCLLSIARKRFQYCSLGDLSPSEIQRENTDFRSLHC